MEDTAAPIKLKLDDDNTLTFEVSIKGAAPGTPVYRLVCETGDMAYAFSGKASPEGVDFTVPALQGRLREGTYDAHLEVIIENKLLIPIQFQAEFGVATRVTVESVQVGSKARERPAVSAAAKLIKVGEPKRPKASPTPAQKKQLTLKELHRIKSRGK